MTNRIYAGFADGGAPHPLITDTQAEAATGDFKPGNLVTVAADGRINLNKNSGIVFGQLPTLAVELGEQYGASIEDTITTGSDCRYVTLRSGERAYVRVNIGVAIEKNAPLTSSLTGFLANAATDGMEQVLFYVDPDFGAAGKVAATEGELVLVYAK